MGLLKLLVCAAIISMPLGQVTRIGIGHYTAVTLTDLLVAVLCLCWIIFLCLQRITWPRASLQKYILLFIAILLVSLAVNIRRFELNEIFSGSLYLFRWLFYASLYFIVKGFDEKYKKKLVYLLLFAGSLFIFFGYLQYMLYPDLRNLIYLGWDDHLFRLFSTVFDPNFAAVLINLFLFLVVGMIIVNKKKSDNFFVGYICLFILGTIALLLTYSRSGYLMFAVGVLTMLFIASKKKLMIPFTIALLVGLLFIPKNLPSEGVNLLRTASIESRLTSMKQALTIIKDNPIFGVGFNMYSFAQERYEFTPQSKFSQMHSAAGTDNSFLFVLATTGIIGLVAYLLLWKKIIEVAFSHYDINRHSGKRSQVPDGTWRSASRISNGLRGFWTSQNDGREIDPKKSIAIVIIGSSVGLFANALFLNSLFYPSVMLWMWVLIAITERT